ncbi:MAG: hypothetical protein J7578_08645 [Chitinophagaceae bacterium]|nr:hypothetical protein [Chitinophagaceae bacterium]
MKIKDINRLIQKHLVPVFPQYTAYQDLLFRIDDEYLLRGYCFEVRGNGEYDLHLHAFVQPLFKPGSGHIHFTFGETIPRKIRKTLFGFKTVPAWDATKENLDHSFQELAVAMQHTGEQFLDSIGDIRRFHEKFDKEKKDNLRVYEAVAFSSILVCNIQKQDRLLQGLIKETRDDEGVEWIMAIRNHATQMLDLPEQHLRLALLKQWAVANASALGLPGVSFD